MSVSVDNPRGGKKSVNSDLDLVPYIDLLTCMVTFLLITAVWTQLARIDVTQKTESANRDAVTEAPPPETKLVVIVDEEGFTVAGSASAGGPQQLGKKDGRYDFATLRAVLQEVKRAFPAKRDIQIASDDGVEYQYLVGVMDTALAAELPDVALTDLSAAHL
ncbi:MAG: biopolymer transporter ExbD [Deltaproteobacteria bacterium]|nr:biopolymer transporter ExbD [Deltaproteobacteria bacterium]